jgi:hypothetical protein
LAAPATYPVENTGNTQTGLSPASRSGGLEGA